MESKNKKYLILLISLAVFLIISIVTIGVLTNRLLSKKSDDAHYTVGEISIKTISKVTNADLELVSHNYYNDSGITYTKTYKYKVSDTIIILTDYNEYLMLEEDFTEVVPFDLSLDSASFTLTKVLEDSNDVCEIEISYTSNSIDISIAYTYIEE